jgi:hypothetical protein
VTPLFAGAVASAYVGTMIGLHRWNVRRLRGLAGGWQALARLDWETLFEGLDRADPARAAFLETLATGAVPPDVAARAEAIGFSGGQARWLERVALSRTSPDAAFDSLERDAVTTSSELYLREYLRLAHRTHPLNLELSVRFPRSTSRGRGLRR